MNIMQKSNYQVEMIIMFLEILKIYRGQNDHKHNREAA